MIYLEREAGPVLRPWVRMLWYAHGMGFAHRRERILPTGCAQMIMNLERNYILDCPEGKPETHMAPALIVGQRSVYEIVDPSDMADLIGVVFEPGALPAFLDDAADRVSNDYVPLDDVCGHAGALRDRLQELDSPNERLHYLECYLLDKFAARRDGGKAGVHPAVRFALRELGKSPSMTGVAAVARSTGWSERRFSQIFREEVGFAPKVWCRIQRFQRVVQRLHGGEEVRWPELALACGFYDQSHLANEFRAFSGVSPTTYGAASHRTWANHLRAD
jgi:AraC-like DNA-binding protein